ncbi:MAG: arginine--tRNA ligase [Candidatus Gottesmanbacteria bacterium]|nr:arginine--tRNA ligase [Candidatus Gottesmanbacteria bacterium]
MKKIIQDLLERVLEGMGVEDFAPPVVSVPENPAHGDYSTNVAMLLSRQLKQSPVKFAEKLKNAIIKDQTISDAGIIDRVEVAGPGFLNIYLSEASLINQVSEVLKTKDAYGLAPKAGKNQHSVFSIQHSDTKKSGQKQGKNTGKTSHAATGSFIAQKPAKIHRKSSANEYMGRQNKKNQQEESNEFIPAKRITIEFAQPNPFKEIHIGHVRNIALGESYSRLAESTGSIVRRVNYEGDVGMHVAKSLWGLERLAKDGVDISGVGLDVRGKAALLGRAYAVGSKAFEGEKSAGGEGSGARAAQILRMAV